MVAPDVEIEDGKGKVSLIFFCGLLWFIKSLIGSN